MDRLISRIRERTGYDSIKTEFDYECRKYSIGVRKALNVVSSRVYPQVFIYYSKDIDSVRSLVKLKYSSAYWMSSCLDWKNYDGTSDIVLDSFRDWLDPEFLLDLVRDRPIFDFVDEYMGPPVVNPAVLCFVCKYVPLEWYPSRNINSILKQLVLFKVIEYMDCTSVSQPICKPLISF